MRLIDPSTVNIFALDIGTRNTGIYARSSLGKELLHTVICDEQVSVNIPFVMSELITEYVLTNINAKAPTLILLEGYSYGKKFFNMFQPEVLGALRVRLALAKFKKGSSLRAMVPLAPSTVRKIVAGSGRATDGAVKKAVKALGYSPKNFHESDAVSLYLAYKQLWMNVTDDCYKNTMFL